MATFSSQTCHAAPGLYTTIGAVTPAEILLEPEPVWLFFFHDHIVVIMHSSGHFCTRSVCHHCAPNDDMANTRPDSHI